MPEKVDDFLEKEFEIVILQNSSTIWDKLNTRIHKFVTPTHAQKSQICDFSYLENVYNRRKSDIVLVLKVTFFRRILQIAIICRNSART